MSVDVKEIADGLTTAQRAGLGVCPAWGFPAGHNAWPDMQYDNGDADDPVCEGEDMDALLRSGLIEAVDEGDGPHEACCFEMADAIWTLHLTPLGKQVRAHLLATEPTA